MTGAVKLNDHEPRLPYCMPPLCPCVSRKVPVVPFTTTSPIGLVVIRLNSILAFLASDVDPVISHDHWRSLLVCTLCMYPTTCTTLNNQQDASKGFHDAIQVYGIHTQPCGGLCELPKVCDN